MCGNIKSKPRFYAWRGFVPRIFVCAEFGGKEGGSLQAVIAVNFYKVKQERMCSVMENKGCLVGIVILICVIIFALSTCSGGSQYDKDLHSGLDKMTSGNGNSMTKSEKSAVNDFLEWQSKQ